MTNSSELQRYFRAAAEAAHEVLAEQGSSALDSRLDVSKFSEAGKALDSPSRMVALNLANGNPLFRCVDSTWMTVLLICFMLGKS